MMEDQHNADGETVVHLGTRDCRARPLPDEIREAPAPALDPDQREEMHRAAVPSSRIRRYRG
ncbi:hypothetical protein QBA38_42420 [Streptomyces stelliscabiei]|uniref:ATP-binding protein n=1 Tax=Streptomyces stelliscabiei TaxID=146820 RepID=UPI002FF2DF09